MRGKGGQGWHGEKEVKEMEKRGSVEKWGGKGRMVKKGRTREERKREEEGKC